MALSFLPFSAHLFKGWRLILLLALMIAGETASATERTARYFRFVPSSLRNSPTTASSVQLSELNFGLRGTVVSMAGVTVANPGGNNPAAETAAKLIDLSTATKWLDFNKQDLVFAFPAAVTIDRYNFATANDSPERDPVSWKLEASDDGSRWALIDSVSNYPVTTVRSTYQAGFSLPVMPGVPGDPVSPQWHPSELLQWNPTTDSDAPFNRGTVPLAIRFTNPALNVNANARFNEGRVMALVAFNNLPTASAQGVRSLRYYPPTYWQYLDTLVFWGGSDRDTRSILAPSAHVIDAAHRNGVPIMGKIFFGPGVYGGQISRVNDFLQKSGSQFPVATKLIEVARYFGFEGWFINQETEGANATTAAAMRDFIIYFKQQAPDLKIIWYDAMAESGSVGWQGALNANNDW